MDLILNPCLWFNDCIHFLSMSVDVSHNFKLWPDFEEISSKNFFLRQKNDFKIGPLQASITKFKRYESIIFFNSGFETRSSGLKWANAATAPCVKILTDKEIKNAFLYKTIQTTIFQLYFLLVTFCETLRLKLGLNLDPDL